MKKGILLLVFLSICLFVFADTQSSTQAATLTDNSFVIKAYYKGAVTTTVSLIVKDYDTNRLYGTDAIATDERHVGTEGTIFSWIMTGTANTELTVKFTFSALQAKVITKNGNQNVTKYYRPAYTLNMYQNKTKSQNGRDLTDSMYSSSTKNVVTYSSKASGNNQYNDPKTVQYKGTVPASGTNNQINYEYWQKTGYCTLKITDYEKNTAGSYEYRCDVSVEFTTP